MVLCHNRHSDAFAFLWGGWVFRLAFGRLGGFCHWRFSLSRQALTEEQRFFGGSTPQETKTKRPTNTGVSMLAICVPRLLFHDFSQFGLISLIRCMIHVQSHMHEKTLITLHTCTHWFFQDTSWIQCCMTWAALSFSMSYVHTTGKSGAKETGFWTSSGRNPGVSCEGNCATGRRDVPRWNDEMEIADEKCDIRSEDGKSTEIAFSLTTRIFSEIPVDDVDTETETYGKYTFGVVGGFQCHAAEKIRRGRKSFSGSFDDLQPVVHNFSMFFITFSLYIYIHIYCVHPCVWKLFSCKSRSCAIGPGSYYETRPNSLEGNFQMLPGSPDVPVTSSNT